MAQSWLGGGHPAPGTSDDSGDEMFSGSSEDDEDEGTDEDEEPAPGQGAGGGVAVGGAGVEDEEDEEVDMLDVDLRGTKGRDTCAPPSLFFFCRSAGNALDCHSAHFCTHLHLCVFRACGCGHALGEAPCGGLVCVWGWQTFFLVQHSCARNKTLPLVRCMRKRLASVDPQELVPPELVLPLAAHTYCGHDLVMWDTCVCLRH
jgi:hypothetical protein